jgi:uncharacterized repeat protein (TIGR01451 family)
MAMQAAGTARNVRFWASPTARIAVAVLALGWSALAAAQANLTVTKTLQSNSDPDGNGQVTVGDTLTYLVRAQNQGYVVLHNVVVSDALITPSSVSCASLSAFAVCDLVGTYTVTSADEAAGVINNTGSATADEVTGTRTSQVNTAVATLATAISVTKYFQGNSDPDGNGLVTVGDTLTFLVRVQNSGNVPLTNVSISDSRLTPATQACALLNRSQLCDLSGTYVVTVADEAAGQVTNTATVTADQIAGPRTAAVTTSVTNRTTAMGATKNMTSNSDPDGNGQVTFGDTLTYFLRAQNTGTQPLTNVVVSDPRLTPGSVTCPVLNRGQLCDLVGTTVVDATDEAAGRIENTATMSSNETGARTVTVNTSVVPRSVSMSLNKYYQSLGDADGNGLVTVGDTLNYLVRVQNTGSVPLTNVVLTDSRITPSTVTCATLNRFQICDLSGTTVVTAGDETAGQVANTATATANEITGTRTATANVGVTARSTNLALNKYMQSYVDADASSSITPGDTLTYLVRAQNTGTQPLTNVVVTDSKITPNTTTCATLARSAPCDLTGTYVVAAGDQAAGKVTNTGSATATEVPAARTMTLSTQVAGGTTALLVNTFQWSNADGDGNGQVTVGDVMTYRVMAHNTGTTVLTNVTAGNALTAPSSLNCATLNPGGVCDLFGTYTVTVADETAGSITVTGTATSSEVPGPLTSSINTPVLPRNTGLAFNTYYWSNSDADGNGQVTVGDTVTFRALMTNTGSQPITNVVVSAPSITPNSLTCATVNASGSCDLFGTRVVTVADEAAGTIDFTASVTSNEAPGPTNSGVTLAVAQRSTGMVFNSYQWSNNDPDANGVVSVGDTLTFRFLMQNSGTQPLTNVVVDAPLLSPGSLTCPTVNAGGTCDLFGTYLVTPADESAGQITISGQATSNEVPGPLPGSQVVSVIPRNLSLVFNNYFWSNTDNDINGLVTVGDVVQFRLSAHNGGTQPLTNVVLTAPGFSPGTLTCPTLNPGVSCDLYATRTVITADETAGAIVLDASATSNELPGPYTSSASTPVARSTVASTVQVLFWTYTDNDANGAVTPGDLMTFRAFMNNTGSVPQNNVVVSVPGLSPASLTCATVNPGGSCDLFATITPTATDADLGYVQVDASVTSNELPTPLSANATTVVRSLTPLLGIVKTQTSFVDNDSDSLITAGDVVSYSVTATNIGFVALTNVTVDDPLLTPASQACATLNAGNQCVLTGTYTVTAADETAGNITNTATANSTETGTPVSDTVVTPVATASTAMSVAKVLTANADGDGDGQVSLGDVLTFTVTATNTGTATLTNLVVTDTLTTPNSATCASVAQSGTCVLTGTYTVTPADATAGTFSNTGSATSNEIGTPVTDTVNTAVVVATTSMSVAKSVIANADGDGNGQVTLGDVLTYSVTATNTGSTTLTNLVVSDVLLTPGGTSCASVPAAGSCSFTGTYTVTSADQSAGTIANTATATSNEIGTPVTFTLNTPVLTPAFSMSLAKAVMGNSDPDGNGLVTAGDVLTYHVRATNTSASTLNNVVVTDAMLTPNSQTCVTLAGGANCDLIGTYTVTPADATAGSIVNNGSATANEIGTPVTTTLTTPVVVPAPAMTLAKTLAANADGDGNGVVTLGDVLTYQVDATNSGNVPLTNVVVNDPITAPNATTCPTLATGATCTLSGTYTVTAADVTAGAINNLGSATSTEAPTVSMSLSVPVVSTVATTLAIVSGDGQVLTPGTASAPMEVELTSGGSPLAGQTIAWTTTGGTLDAATSTTDANGKASTTVTISASGAVTVTADFAGSPGFQPSSVAFTHNSTIASIPLLTPETVEVADALDNACAELATLTTRTPEQQDLYEQCLALTVAAAADPAAVAEAVEQMLPDVAATQTQASQAASTAQFDNLNARMNAVRTGRQQGASLAGLGVVGSGGFLPLAGFVGALTQDDAPAATDATPPDESGFSRWGFFASGRIGRGESDPGRITPAYDYDIQGLTAGVDYRKSDNLVLGAALGYTRQDTDLAGGEGSLDTRGWSLSGYATWYRGQDWYLDSLLSYAHNSYGHRRRIVYALPMPDGSTFSVDQVATADSSGTDWTLAATFGRDVHHGAWSMSYYGRAIYDRIAFGAFRERVDETAPGAGLALDVGSRTVTSASGVLGTRISYAHSADWGVLTPQLDLEFQREFKDDPGAFRAVFASDPSQTPIVILGEPSDRSYFRLGIGLSWVLVRGRSGFVQYDRTLARDGMEQENLSLGLRIEF